MDEERRKTGQKLLIAAQDFWNACNKEGQYGAVQWLTGTNGELLIYTRGEYRDRLMGNIEDLSDKEKIHKFSEAMPTDDDSM